MENQTFGWNWNHRTLYFISGLALLGMISEAFAGPPAKLIFVYLLFFLFSVWAARILAEMNRRIVALEDELKVLKSEKPQSEQSE